MTLTHETTDSPARPVEPTSSAPTEERPSLGAVVRGHRLGLLASAVLAVIGAACSLAPYLGVYAVTSALLVPGGAGSQAVPGIAGWVGAAVLVGAAAKGLSTHVGHVAAYRILADLRILLARTLQRLPLGRVQARSTGEMKKVLHDDVEQPEEALAHGIPDGAAAAAVPVTMTITLFVIDWRLALVALASLVLLIVVSGVGMAMAQRNNAALAEHSTLFNKTVLSYLQGIKVIRGYLRPDTGYDQAREVVVEAARLQDRATSGPVRWLVAAMSVATGLAVALLIPATGLRLVDGGLELGTMVLFLLLALAYLTPVIGLVCTLATVMIRIQFAAASVRELLEEEPLAAPTTPRVPQRHDVTFEGVTFSYRADGEPVIRDLSLQVPEGSTVALVGPTGSGKSTLARLVARFYDVDSGAVRIGGVDVRQVPVEELSRTVAFIQQDEYIFAASLRENIRIARPEATDAEVELAGERAQLSEVAARLGQGWDTELAGGGGTLSGGERQRVSIARALLKDARVIVLDEVTASLDATTERRTLAAIADVTEGRTVIAIAHRLATIRDSNQIVVLQDGTVVGRGGHDEVLEQCRLYRDLWHAYSTAAGWRLAAAPGAPEHRSPAAETAPQPIPSTAYERTREWTEAARAIVRPHVGRMPFARQWRTLYGRSWSPLVRRGLIRLVLESLVRGAPLVAILVVVLTALDEDPWGWTLDARMVWIVTGVLLLALTVRLLTSAWANQLIWSLAARSKADLQLSVLERLRRVPMGFFGRVDNGRIGTLVGNDIPMVDFQNVPQQVAGSLIQPLLSVIILTLVDWRLALAALAGLPVFWLLTVWSDRIYHRVFTNLYEARQEATTVLIEQARGAAVLRGNPESLLARRYDTAIERLRETSIAMSVRATPATSLGSVAVEAGQVLLIVVGAALYGAEAVSAATLLLFLMLSLTLYQPIQELMLLAGYRRNQQQIAVKLAEVWDQPALPEPASPAQPADSSVEFRDVSFRYAEHGPQTLSGVTFRAEPGQVTALVGSVRLGQVDHRQPGGPALGRGRRSGAARGRRRP